MSVRRSSLLVFSVTRCSRCAIDLLAHSDRDQAEIKTDMRTSALKVDLTFFAAGILFVFLLLPTIVPTRVFSCDESDYMYAASRGFVSNYLDRPRFRFLRS